MLTNAGAKLLDFGLAKHGAGLAGAAGRAGEAPTMTSPITAQGTILGTFQYIAPEQLEGKEADAGRRRDAAVIGGTVASPIGTLTRNRCPSGVTVYAEPVLNWKPGLRK